MNPAKARSSKRMANLWFSLAMAMVISALPAGCVMSPLHDDVIPTTTSPVYFEGLTTISGQTVTAQCATHIGDWRILATFTASTFPDTRWTDAGPPATSYFPFRAARTIPDACWDRGFARPVTYLRLVPGTSYYAFGRTAFRCLMRQWLGSGNGVNAASACSDLPGGQIRLFAEK